MKQRTHIAVRGAVQGVGFRPFVYRLAAELRLSGWVMNTPQGVRIDAEGEEEDVHRFVTRLSTDAPPRSFLQSLEHTILDPVGYTAFEIRPSTSAGDATAIVLPDIATCPECLVELRDPHNRRYRYPFTNCTHCGPRFSIIESLPYDRPNTTMKGFTMCRECRHEYEDPADRRFHAQPNACPVCGPSLEAWDPAGSIVAREDDALVLAAHAIRNGQVVALKGIGGFHLLVDARNAESVALLRARKHRQEKPFALMAPSRAGAAALCLISEMETRLLTSAEAPIVLLRRRPDAGVAPDVAPGNPTLGLMLPYTPLHHLLMDELGFPVVATSGNLSDEPICTEEREAVRRLEGIADLFLVHNRPIHRPIDDSVARVVIEREMLLRRARGYAPLPVELPENAPDLLAVGAHLKSCIAVSKDRNVFISQHLGDLETAPSLEAFRNEVNRFRALFHVSPRLVVSDSHPDYLSTKEAGTYGLEVLPVQHHYAHVASCMADNGITGHVLGVSWDGTGYGPDGTVWGGEFLRTTEQGFERCASLRPFLLPGGDRAIREPRRTALGVLFDLFGSALFDRTDLEPLVHTTSAERTVFQRMLERGLQSPVTTSAGRLFDAVASIIGIRQRCTFEGQAAMELEFLAEPDHDPECYPVELAGDFPRVDWRPVITAILSDLQQGISPATIARRFHTTMTEAIVAVARMAGMERVVLTGGCFQNRLLTEGAVHRLEDEGFRVYWHQRVPPNDGGIALGQIFAALRSGAL